MAEIKKNFVTYENLKENDGTEGKSLWILINNKVYDVTLFNHPGGKDVFVGEDFEFCEDLYEKFEDVGHSPSAYKMLKKYYLWDLQKFNMNKSN